MISTSGWHRYARRSVSPNADVRPVGVPLRLIVIHNISLPPGVFGGPYVEQFFRNRLPAHGHPFFSQIAGVKVSAHFFLQRKGALIQFVSTEQRAWHAGLSTWRGMSRCNDFSVGIEVEGADDIPYTAVQYKRLGSLVKALVRRYPTIDGIAGHAEIAPGRKTDPGPAFDWARFMSQAGLPQRFRKFD